MLFSRDHFKIDVQSELILLFLTQEYHGRDEEIDLPIYTLLDPSLKITHALGEYQQINLSSVFRLDEKIRFQN